MLYYDVEIDLVQVQEGNDTSNRCLKFQTWIQNQTNQMII